MSEPKSPALEAAEIATHTAEQAKLKVETRKLEIEEKKQTIELDRLRRYDREQSSKANENRIFELWGEVSGGSARAAVTSMGDWSRQFPGEKMTFVLNSPGGGVIPGLALYDFIQELKNIGHEIETVSIGFAASMGGVLLQAGTHRVMGRNAWLLIHEVSSHGAGKVSELEDEVKFVKRLQDQLLTILSERSTLSKTQIAHRWKRQDWWLSAAEALELGFVDEIR